MVMAWAGFFGLGLMFAHAFARQGGQSLLVAATKLALAGLVLVWIGWWIVVVLPRWLDRRRANPRLIHLAQSGLNAAIFPVALLIVFALARNSLLAAVTNMGWQVGL